MDFNARNQLFEVITGPYAMQSASPLMSQEVIAKALQAIGEPPSSTLIVSGNLQYLQFAQSLGIATLQFSGLPNLEITLNQALSSEVPGS